MFSLKSFTPFFFYLLAATGGAQTVVNDTFSDNERLTDSAPNSLRWTSGAHHSTAASAFTSLDASGGQLFWDHTTGGNNSFSGIWGHFIAGASPLTLLVGETMTLGFDVTFSGGLFSTSPNGFRWALFDSNNSRITTDFAGTNATGISSGTTFSGWRGYVAQLAANSSEVAGSTFLTRERVLSGNGLFVSAEYADIAGSSVDEPTISAATPYHATLTLERTVGGMIVQGSFNGVSTIAGTDATPVTEFDTISFFTLDVLTQDITLDNISLTVTPEPTCAALLSLSGIVWLGARRKGHSI